ncbi:zinc finger HIT domain-containing protein 1 isoform X4 [Monodelphis domestica]|uniref:zinc finger HIT domain-containing protein 1 isoform X4 n=1 Tax=Monodelphis domestica TaxID=13616 RepID=UPI0004435FDB|nr:zinc finger HIT domain-containing protein 1 isoform X4 [Monodelphis domestica]
MVEKKPSVRSQDPGQRRVLDRAARQRRINRQLEALENDNFQDDPHAGLPQLGKRLPQFDDDADTGKKKKKTRGDHFKLRFRKNFQALLEEQPVQAPQTDPSAPSVQCVASPLLILVSAAELDTVLFDALAHTKRHGV